MKLLTALALFLLTVVVTVLVMIHGWGLTPNSWGWILGGAAFNLLALIIMNIVKDD